MISTVIGKTVRPKIGDGQSLAEPLGSGAFELAGRAIAWVVYGPTGLVLVCRELRGGCGGHSVCLSWELDLGIAETAGFSRFSGPRSRHGPKP